MPEVPPHIVAAEGQHSHRVASHLPDGAGRRRGHLTAHRGPQKNPVAPVERLEDQRHDVRTTPSEDDGGDRHPLRIECFGSHGRIVGGRRSEPRIGVSRFLFGGRSPRIALPVQTLDWRRVIVAFPPNCPIRLECDVGVDRITRDGHHRIGVGLGISARRHPEVARLGINGPQTSVRTRPHPRDIIAHGPYLPALKPFRRNHHGKVRLAAGAREGCCDVAPFTLGRLHCQDQHVLRQPPLPPPQVRSDAQG